MLPAAGPSNGHAVPGLKVSRPIQLTQIILVAEDEDSYSWACHHQQGLKSHFCASERIYKQGERVSIPCVGGLQNGAHPNGDSVDEPAIRTAKFEIVMTEPVLRGYCSSVSTEFIVTPPSDFRANHHSESDLTTGSFDIDEDFLAASLLGGLSDEEDSDDRMKENLELNGGQQAPTLGPTNGFSLHAHENRSKSHHRMVCVASLGKILERPLQHLLSEGVEDETLIASIRTEDLGKLGLFHGDRVSGSCLRPGFSR